jgi:hypothetical protein
MKIFFDCEFIDDKERIHLLSIGLVREDGSQYYAEPVETDRSLACPWVKANVLPHMTGPVKPRNSIALEIFQFVERSPEFWTWFGAYDWVCLCQLYGRMLDVPPGWPNAMNDLRQLIVHEKIGRDFLPPQYGTAHNALADAIWIKESYEHVLKRIQR